MATLVGVGANKISDSKKTKELETKIVSLNEELEVSKTEKIELEKTIAALSEEIENLKTVNTDLTSQIAVFNKKSEKTKKNEE